MVDRSRFKERWKKGRDFWKGSVVVVVVLAPGFIVVVIGGGIGGICPDDASDPRRSKFGRETLERLFSSSPLPIPKECVEELLWFRTNGAGELRPLARLVGETPPFQFPFDDEPNSASSVVRISRSVR